MRKRLPSLLLVPLALMLSSCVYDIDPGGGGGSYGYGGGYSSGNYGLPWGVGGGYRSNYCNRCRSYSCSCHHDPYDHHDHDRYKKSSSDLKHRENSYRIAGGSTGGKKKPTGYHSVGWYESRGYDTSHLRLEDERGNRYGGSSSSSSNHRSSSSSSRSSSSSSGSSKSSSSSSKSSGSSSKSSSSRSSSSGGSSKSSSSSSKSSGSSNPRSSRSSGEKGRSRS